jgi:hypothetical protein
MPTTETLDRVAGNADVSEVLHEANDLSSWSFLIIDSREGRLPSGKAAVGSSEGEAGGSEEGVAMIEVELGNEEEVEAARAVLFEDVVFDSVHASEKTSTSVSLADHSSSAGSRRSRGGRLSTCLTVNLRSATTGLGTENRGLTNLSLSSRTFLVR